MADWQTYIKRRGDGVVERARLEIECAPKVYRGFESPPLRVLNFTRTSVKFFLPIRRQSAPQTASRDTTHLTRFVFSDHRQR